MRAGWSERWAVSLLAVAFCGCDAGKQPGSAAPVAPNSPLVENEAPHPAAAPTNPIDPESKDWSLEEALANLEEPDLGLSAAVRLVRLADVHVPMLPDPLPIEAARKLRLIALSDSAYALGVGDDGNDRLVRTPLLIDLEGSVSNPGDDEPVDLYVSPDGDVFPHLLIGPTTVMNAANFDNERIHLKSTERMRFEVRQENGVDYLSLIHLGRTAAVADTDEKPEANGEVEGDHPKVVSAAHSTTTTAPVEVARYQWDPFEAMFLGPARDKLAPPLVGRFELDLKSSTWLQPVGGEIGEPDPVTSPDEDDENDWD